MSSSPPPASSEPTSSMTAVPTIAGLELPSLKKKAAVQPRPRALVLIDPSAAFAATVRRPLLALMLVVASVFAVVPAGAFLIAAQRQGGVEAVVKDQMKKSGALDKIKARVGSSDDAERTVSGLGKAMTVVVPAGAVAQRLGWLLFVAAGCFFGLRGTKKDLSFTTVAAVVVVGAAPLFVHDVVSAVGLLTLPSGSIDTKNVVASNLAALFYVDDNRSAVAAVLRGLDVFELWACWLMGAGVVFVVGGRTRWPWLVTFGARGVFTLISVIRGLSD